MIFFSDLDGTFVTSDKRITDENWRALDEIAARGLEFVPCTGRCATGVPAELLAHPAVRHVVAVNGAVVASVRNGKPVEPALRRVDLGRERALALYELSRGRDVLFDVFADGVIYTARADYERIPEFVDDLPTRQLMLSNRTPVDEPLAEFLARPTHVERVSMSWKNPQDAGSLRAEIACDASLSCVSSTPFNLEISDVAGAKGIALAWLCEHLGADRAESVAFGDNINDLSMIEAAGTGVAMANALPEVKAVANAVADSCDKNGVGRFILRALGK